VYRLISSRNPADKYYLASMHNLRFRIFKERLGWLKGESISRMEFDEYDTDNAVYLVKIDPEDHEVCACTRLIQTTYPYLLANSFPHFVEKELPRSESCYETSRFAADVDKKQPFNITGELVAAMLEFGVAIGMRHYVSLSDIRIEKLLLRSGWDPTPLGPVGKTANEDSVAFIYTVNQEILGNVRLKSKVESDLIVNLKEFISSYYLDIQRRAA